jgi:NTP pyrophosphatase (non-canonical NTP hydrolase)
MQLAELQDVLRRTYLDRDSARGADGVFRWMVEEVGEVARAMRAQPRDQAELEHEFSDVLAWLGSLANLLDVDLDRAAQRYAGGCPKCGAIPCACGVRP